MRNQVREAGAAVRRRDAVPVLRRQPRDDAILDVRGKGEWSGKRAVDGIVSIGDVPESRLLREELNRRGHRDFLSYFLYFQLNKMVLSDLNANCRPDPSQEGRRRAVRRRNCLFS